MRTGERALGRGLAVATAGTPLNAIGDTVQRTVHAAGFAVCDGLMGHGIGPRVHEAPDVPNVYDPSLTQPLKHTIVVRDGAPLVLTA
ncbi:MAG: methionyl aminopeptidase [bacterium]